MSSRWVDLSTRTARLGIVDGSVRSAEDLLAGLGLYGESFAGRASMPFRDVLAHPITARPNRSIRSSAFPDSRRQSPGPGTASDLLV